MDSPRAAQPLLEESGDPLLEDEPVTHGGTSGLLCGIVFSVACTCSAAAVIQKERGTDGAMIFAASYLMELSLVSATA